LKLGSKEAVKRAKTRGHIDSCDSIGESVGVVPVEIVSHLGLDLNVGMNGECSAASQADEIDWSRRPGITEIIGKSTDLNVIGIPLREQRHGGKKQEYEWPKTMLHDDSFSPSSSCVYGTVSHFLGGGGRRVHSGRLRFDALVEGLVGEMSMTPQARLVETVGLQPLSVQFDVFVL
jgi:hypothetical protein